MLADLAPYAMLIAGIPLTLLTLLAFGWRGEGNDTHRHDAGEG